MARHMMGTFCKTLGSAGLVVGLLAAPLASAWADETEMEEEPVGKDEYRNNCLPCHGVSGKGDGPIAEYFTVKPSDLTQIAKRHDGVFPFLDVLHIIDGRNTLRAHGDADMPVWGDTFEAEAADRYGPYGGEIAVRGRILSLVYYLQSIQE